jgi:hypothetical protein
VLNDMNEKIEEIDEIKKQLALLSHKISQDDALSQQRFKKLDTALKNNKIVTKENILKFK